MKKNNADGDVLGVVQRALRRASAEDRTQLMELVVGAMIDSGDFGSLAFWHGELEHALMQYFQMLNKTERGVRQECWRNLGPGLQERLKGRMVVEEARRQG